MSAKRNSDNYLPNKFLVPMVGVQLKRRETSHGNVLNCGVNQMTSSCAVFLHSEVTLASWLLKSPAKRMFVQQRV